MKNKKTIISERQLMLTIFIEDIEVIDYELL